MNCAQVDEALSSEEAETEGELEGMADPGAVPPLVSSSPTTTVSSGVVSQTHEMHRRRGKVPPLANFIRQHPEYILND